MYDPHTRTFYPQRHPTHRPTVRATYRREQEKLAAQRKANREFMLYHLPWLALFLLGGAGLFVWLLLERLLGK